MNNKNIFALLPLDNRPVSYLLPKQIAEFAGIKLLLPERKHLGDLNKSSDLRYLEGWLKSLKKDSSLIIALDNWVYGGLVQSRKHSIKLDALKARTNLIKELNEINKYGFSSIMRIANYNNAEEEKGYWKDYGEKIFNWSKLTHKVGAGAKEKETSHEELIENWYQSSKLIPKEIIADYKSHRDKNFTLNLIWLDSLHQNCFKYLVFSCDDSASYGMNVVEAEYLKKEIKNHNFTNHAKVISGTDEIPLVLLTKAVLESSNQKPALAVYFNSIPGANEVAKYESNSIRTSILNQIETFGVELIDNDKADMILFVHTSDSKQGDHVFKEISENTEKNAEKIIEKIRESNKPFILLDLAYANGSDPVLVELLLKSKLNWDLCYGYSAWNTCSNSTGSALGIGINRYIAERKRSFDAISFKKCLLTRFLDDYAYQAKIRHSHITEKALNEKIQPYVQNFAQLLGLHGININCSLPWKRSFEVEITI